MHDESKGKMFLSGERGHTETEWFRSDNTFNFGNYKNDNKEPFGPLYVLNDDTLAGGKSFKLLVEEDSDILLLPIVGAIAYKDNIENETLVYPGEAQIFSVNKGTTIEIANPHENELINFIQLWIRSSIFASSIPGILSFNIESNKNVLVDLLPPLSQENKNHNFKRICVGKFDGREEVIYKPAGKKNGVFVFVLEGAFEVQYRLMEARDGLALWNLEELEIEALSNAAIILLVEMEIKGVT